MTDEHFDGVGGTKLYARTWRPDGQPRGVVVINHGFKSHSGYYEWPAQQLARRGLAVYALDMRGHGQSEGERLFTAKWSDYVGDLANLVALAQKRDPGLPVFALGHSAGGVVACTYVLDHPTELAGFICESFAHELPAPDFALAILKGLGHVAPHAHVLKLANEDFSRDPQVVQQMTNDALIPKIGYPAQTVGELVRADERLKKEFELIRLPLLVLHGSEDHAAKPHGSQRLHELASSTDKTLKTYQGHFHDLLNDVGKEEVMADIVEWITTRLPRA